VLLLAGFSSTPALAQGHAHPRLFALSASDFPPGSQIVRAGVEGNRMLTSDEGNHFGAPPSLLGRRTGYYMEAVETDPAGQETDISYLVSIFHTPHQAFLAFDFRWQNWFAANFYTTPSSVQAALGDRGDVALFHTLDPTQQPLTELFFRRGAVLVEVFQSTADAVPTSAQQDALYAIAAKLNDIAGAHPSGI
jgi:hypothetical protein